MLKNRPKARLGIERLETRLVMSTYYIAPTGSDSNDGSSQHPWLTIQHGADMAHPGDTIDVRAGNYRGFNIPSSGTASAPITFTGESGAVINQPQYWGGIYFGINASQQQYLKVQGFTIVSQTNDPEWKAGIRIGGTPGSWVHGNVIANNTCQMRVVGQSTTTDQFGIFSSWNDGLLIQNNNISGAWDSGIYASNSSRNYTIRGNQVSNCGGNGIHNNGDLSAGSPGINYNALIENNVIHNVGFSIGGQAISCDGVQDSRIQNNIIYDAHAKGISLYAQDAAEGCKRDIVANNTVVIASDGYVALRQN